MLDDPALRDLHPHHAPPRASLVAAPGDLPGLRTALWMGGAHSLTGEPLHVTALGHAWLVDCAGDLPPTYRAAAAEHFACVFSDLEVLTLPSRHILPLVDRLAASLTDGTNAPASLYVMCTHGMNRSGLLTGLLLRRLGLAPEAAIERIRRARPGALSNESFRRFILRG